MSSILKGGSRVLLGTVAGFVVALTLTPLLSRLYSPEVFGRFGILVAIASTFVGVSTCRLEVLALAEADDQRYRALTWKGLELALLVGVLATLVAAIAAGFGAPAASPLIGVMITVGSLQLLGTSALSRGRRYGALARNNFVHQGGQSAVQVVLGATGSVWSLVIGFLAPRLVWLPSVLRLQSGREPHLTPNWRQAAPAGGSALFNSLGSQVAVLAVGGLYGAAGTGLVALAQRVFLAPLQMVAQAVSAASTAEVSAMIREGRPSEAQGLVNRSIRSLALVAALPTVAAAVVAPMVAGTVLGSEWRQVGILISALSLGAFAQFCTAPFAQVLNLTGQSGTLLKWDLARTIVIAASLLVPGLLGATLTQAVFGYSAGLAATYVALAVLVHRATSELTTKGSHA